MNNPNILLKGLDGSNPLAFLAALGTLRTLTLALPDETAKMSWEQSEGAWRPRVWCSLADNDEVLIETLNDRLTEAKSRKCFAIGDNLNLQAIDFRAHLCASIEHVDDLTNPTLRMDADFLAAFGSEVVTNDDGTMQDTALRTMSGAGHQHFLKFIRELVIKTNPDHLRRSLLNRWDYADEGRGMNLRWDPLDDRRYAMRWEDPSTDPSSTMRGANRLAVEALPLLPTMPTQGRLATTAFQTNRSRKVYFTWPIWTTLLSTPVVTSLLSKGNEIVGQTSFNNSIGIATLFSSARITIGKFRNFTPAVPADSSIAS